MTACRVTAPIAITTMPHTPGPESRLADPVAALNRLPPPPPGKKGWPWTTTSRPLPDKTPDGSPWPLISVVTPSFNQGRYIEQTIRSVLLQGYPNLQYIIMDGGSTDSTSVILRRYRPFVSIIVSEKDRGQSHALNKGVLRAEGQLIGWQNSDDLYLPNAFSTAAAAWLRLHRPDAVYGALETIDAASAVIGRYRTSPFNPVEMFPWANMFNQSMFFSRSVVGRDGLVDEHLHHCMDYDLFWRMILDGRRLEYVPDYAAYFRLHGDAKGFTQTHVAAREFFAIYQMLYRRRELPPLVRQGALNSMRGLCYDHFGKARWDLFHEQIHALRRTAGWRRLGRPLMVRYLLSRMGPRFVGWVKGLRPGHGRQEAQMQVS